MPTNESIDQLIADGDLHTWDDVAALDTTIAEQNTLYHQYVNEIDAFLRYHIQDNAIVINADNTTGMDKIDSEGYFTTPYETAYLAKKSGLLDWLLDSVLVVAIMLVVGGVFMLFCDKLFNKGSDANKVNEKRAFNIGLYQCISVIPGVSRSMATIVGGMTQGLTRQRAAEFSFFLAVPTMAGATLLDLLDLLKEDAAWATTHNITMLILGCVVAFIVALLAMKWFVAFLTKYGFKTFGYYSIIVGGIILVLLLTGHSLAMVD